MKKVYFSLMAQHIEFDTDEQKTEIEKLKEYIFMSECLTHEDIEKLFNGIMSIKSDWMGYDFNEDKSNIYVSITLLYPYTEGKKVTNIPTKIISIIESFINKMKSCEQEEIDVNVENLQKDETEGILLKVTKYSDADTKQFLSELKRQNISYEIITKTVNRTETGAGNTFFEIILYIQNTVLDGVTSGAAWDITKWGFLALISRSGNGSNNDEIKAEKIKYKKLLKSVSIRANVKTKDLTLIDSYKSNSETIFEFKANNSKIMVICAEDYTILEMHTEETENSNQEV